MTRELKLGKKDQWWDGLTGPRTLAAKFSSPSILFRNALGAKDYVDDVQGPSTNNITAAAVFSKEIPYGHLLDSSWALIARRPTFNVVMVSTAHVDDWIRKAQQSGALCVRLGHPGAIPWVYKDPILERHAIIKDGRHLSNIERVGLGLTRSGRPKGQNKEYDKAAILEDLQNGATMTALSEKWHISRFSVFKVAEDAGLTKKRVRKG